MNVNSKSANESNSIDLKEVIATYTKHWKWFALSAFLALVLLPCFT